MPPLWAKREEQFCGVFGSAASLDDDLRSFNGKTLQDIEGRALQPLPTSHAERNSG